MSTRTPKTNYKKRTTLKYVPKKTDTDEGPTTTTTTRPTPEKDSGEKASAVETRPTRTGSRSPSPRPTDDRPPTRTKQEQIRDTTAPPPGRGATTSRDASPTRERETGVDEETRQAIAKVRDNFNVKQLTDLWTSLNTEEAAPELVEAVRRQVIRAQLYDLMGGNITTLTNIQVDGDYVGTTSARDVTKVTRPDKEVTGRDQASGLWNNSVLDSEVDTTRDLKAWAKTFDPRGKAEVRFDLVGTSGPCPSCQTRMKIAGDEILADWSTKYNVSKEDLPQLRIMSYYGNNPKKPFSRGGWRFWNGWSDDEPVEDMAFRNRAGWDQAVQEHELAVIDGNTRPTPRPGGTPRTATAPVVSTQPVSAPRDSSRPDSRPVRTKPQGNVRPGGLRPGTTPKGTAPPKGTWRIKPQTTTPPDDTSAQNVVVTSDK
jgi:hypothetical protein